MRRLRSSARRQRRRDDGRYVWALGGRVGYWPCLHAPFVRLDLGPWIVEAWHGEPSYMPWADRA